ncbi:MAG TPA: hypothetical protein VFL63_11315 [Rhodanobacteraceae bacterium]|nr:hypothetical protein [Rhodanobacteraceae bacterium]
MYPVVRIHASRAEAVEDLGTKAKFWYHDDNNGLTLFKAEERGTGEDWAEKIACELAGLLGLPHVQYNMAYDEDNSRPGVVCASFTPGELALAHGNQLLFMVDANYPRDAERHYLAHAHTVDAVFGVVRLLKRPSPDWCQFLPVGIHSAPGVFAGYLMLDAWVANQDRHHENWGAVWDGKELSLAPSFDHGAALARNLDDAERLERLQSRDVHRQIPYFAQRARSALFANPNDKHPLTTLAAWRAFAAKVPAEAALWRRQLEMVDEGAIKFYVDSVPLDRMSAVCRQFTLNLLSENRRRILESEEP